MKRIRKIASDFARRMNISTLPIEFEKLEEIAAINDWKIVSYSKGYNFIKSENLEKYCYTSKGFTYSSNDCTIIFIKDDLEYLDKINVICHEIGHIVLRHIEVGSKQKSNTDNNKNKTQEIEADIFALEFQAPVYLMKNLSINTAKRLYNEGIFYKSDALRQALYFYSTRITSTKISLCIAALLLIFNLCHIFYENKNTASISNSNIKPVTLNFIEKEAQIEITSESAENPTTELKIIETAVPQSNKKVKVTKSGKKYHLPDCHYVAYKNNTTELEIEEALRIGYTPCSVCRPE